MSDPIIQSHRGGGMDATSFDYALRNVVCIRGTVLQEILLFITCCPNPLVGLRVGAGAEGEHKSLKEQMPEGWKSLLPATYIPRHNIFMKCKYTGS